jgi:multidrug resistance efflux pump
MRGKWLLFSGTLILAAAGAGSLTWLRRATPHTNRTVMPAAAPAPRELSLAGKIQALHVVPVGATVTGTIDAFLAEPGQDVYEGQVLARIGSQSLEAAREEAARLAQVSQDKMNSMESRMIAARLEASRAHADAKRERDQLDRLEKVYLRQQMLNREGATPRLVYEKSEREFEAARAQSTSLDELARQADDRVSELVRELETAKQEVSEHAADLESATVQAAGTEIRSPVSGIVVARKGEPGKMLAPGEAGDLFEIAADLSQFVVAIQPDREAMTRIRSGQEAMIFVAELPGAIPATVKEVKGDEVIVEFTSPSAVIRPGMTAQVRLRLE